MTQDGKKVSTQHLLSSVMIASSKRKTKKNRTEKGELKNENCSQE